MPRFDVPEDTLNLENLGPVQFDDFMDTGPYNTRLCEHVYFRYLVLTNGQWMYIFSESLLSSLELSL